METRSQFYCKLDINYPLKLQLKQLLVATSNNFPNRFRFVVYAFGRRAEIETVDIVPRRMEIVM